MSVILPEYLIDKDIIDERKALVRQFNKEMELVINKNKDKDKYWILGKVKFLAEFNGKVARIFLGASDRKPPLVKGAFLYEVDNRRGVKELLWWEDGHHLNVVPTKKKFPVSPT